MVMNISISYLVVNPNRPAKAKSKRLQKTARKMAADHTVAGETYRGIQASKERQYCPSYSNALSYG